MSTDEVKRTAKKWGPKAVVAFSYLITTAMIVASGLMMMGAAMFAVLFGEWTIAGFGFVGAIVCGGQGILGLLRQLNLSFLQQQVRFEAGRSL